jgi:gluconolactonase
VSVKIPGPPELLPGCPDAIIDLQTDEGAALADGQWRYSDTRVRRTGFVSVGADLGPSGPANRTYEVVPRAHAADFGDSAWTALSPADTQRRLSTGRVCFNWMRTATLDFYSPFRARADEQAPVEIIPGEAGRGALGRVVPPDARLERVAGGFEFTEGPVWTRDGALLFSSPNTNTIYRWTPAGPVAVFRPKSGYTGTDIGRYAQPGSNGLTFDPEGRLTICQHGNRRVIRVEPHGNITVLAETFAGKRLNSPNDLVYASDGTLYFTDPPFGLPEMFADPKKELPFSGVYRVRDGVVSLVTPELAGPNGIAFSPDERYLYVGNWDPVRKVVMRYTLGPGGSVTGGEVFFDMTGAEGEDAIDGLKVDVVGNLYVCGPSGIWLLSPHGDHLGTLRLPESPHNLAWGDEDARTLYITALTSIYRIRLCFPGVRPH